jgi:hypothetical protein
VKLAVVFKEGWWSLGDPGATLGEVLAAFGQGGDPVRVVYQPSR